MAEALIAYLMVAAFIAGWIVGDHKPSPTNLRQLSALLAAGIITGLIWPGPVAFGTYAWFKRRNAKITDAGRERAEMGR